MSGLYTSNFSRRLTENQVGIAISRSVPSGYRGARLEKLAPTWACLREWKQAPEHGKQERKRYIDRYWAEVLCGQDPAQVAAEIRALAGDKDAVLLCYERPNEFCHRLIVAKWLSKNGFECAELT